MEGARSVPLGRVWLGARFDFDRDPDLPPDGFRLWAPVGERPLLLVGAALDGDDLDVACGVSLARVFLARYGEETMIATACAWDRIAAEVEFDRGIAAD